MIQGKVWSAVPEEWRCKVAGIDCDVWYRLWKRCHNEGFTGPVQWCWPDGGSLLGQYAITVSVFDLIDKQIRLELALEEKKAEAERNVGKRN